MGKQFVFRDLYFICEYYPHFKNSIGLRKNGPYSNLWTGANYDGQKKKRVSSNKFHTAWRHSKTVTTINWKRKNNEIIKLLIFHIISNKRLRRKLPSIQRKSNNTCENNFPEKSFLYKDSNLKFNRLLGHWITSVFLHTENTIIIITDGENRYYTLILDRWRWSEEKDN